MLIGSINTAQGFNTVPYTQTDLTGDSTELWAKSDIGDKNATIFF